MALAALSISACTEHGITNPNPIPTPGGNSHPGFDTSIYPGDATMSAWVKPASPYKWVGYYLQAPCHRDPSWMTQAELLSGAVTCSRTLVTTEQGTTDGIDAVTKTAAERFPAGTVIYLDIEHMDSIPASMDAYYRAWVQQVLADGRFRPGIYVHKANAAAIYEGVRRAYADMNATGTAVFWVTSSSGFSIDKSPDQVGFAFASVWQGILEVTQTWNGASINIDVDVAAMSSPSSP